MTESEALEEIVNDGINLGAGDYVDIEALKVAVKALEEIQQYRAIGTVEECREALQHSRTQDKRENQPNGDLISRSALLEMLRYNAAEHTDENGETRQLIAIEVNRLIEYVEKMPTAFDVDKVVEQEENFLVNFGIPKNTKVHREIINIVKRGGMG